MTGSVGSSLCSMSSGLQVIDRQVLCGGHVVRQKDPTMFESLPAGHSTWSQSWSRVLRVSAAPVVVSDAD